MHGKRIVSEKCLVTVNRKIKDTEGTYILRIKNDFIAANFKPGQFVMVKINPDGLNPLLSRPFSIFNKFNDSEFEILYRVFGKGTEILSNIKEGTYLDVTGPLGNGFSLNKKNKNAGINVLIAGGIGIAPLHTIPLFLGESLSADAQSTVQDEESVNSENSVNYVKTVLYYGAKKAEELYFRHSIHAMFDEVYFATDDGSFGYKGSIVDLLYENIDVYKNLENTSFYACGPKPMLNSLISRFYTDGLSGKLQVSLEESFGCGIGVCLGCVVKTKPDNNAGNISKSSVNKNLNEDISETDNIKDNISEPPVGDGINDGANSGVSGKSVEFQYKRVCKDGPVFYASEIFISENENPSSSINKAGKTGKGRETAAEQSSIVERSNASAYSSLKDGVKIVSPDISVKLGNLKLDYPVMPASGTFGYGEEFFEIIEYNNFGALVTKGISLSPSKGNEMPRICETSCGMINSIGLQNVGYDKFIEAKMPFLKTLNKPVIVNFYGSSIEEYAELAKKLGETEGISAIEANISCPNIKEGGRSFGSDPEVVYELVSSVKESTGGKIPLIVKLTPMVNDISFIAEVCEKAGADIISLINTLPAASIDIKTKKFKLSRGYGGLSGAAVKPVAIKLVGDVYNAVRIPVIGMGGISSWQDAVEFFLAGATAVAVGTYSFVNPKIIPEISAGLKNYLAENGFDDIYQIIGLAHDRR